MAITFLLTKEKCISVHLNRLVLLSIPLEFSLISFESYFGSLDLAIVSRTIHLLR